MEDVSIRSSQVQCKDRQGTCLLVANFESSESMTSMSRNMECRNTRNHIYNQAQFGIGTDLSHQQGNTGGVACASGHIVGARMCPRRSRCGGFSRRNSREEGNQGQVSSRAETWRCQWTPAEDSVRSWSSKRVGTAMPMVMEAIAAGVCHFPK